MSFGAQDLLGPFALLVGCIIVIGWFAMRNNKQEALIQRLNDDKEKAMKEMFDEIRKVADESLKVITKITIFVDDHRQGTNKVNQNIGTLMTYVTEVNDKLGDTATGLQKLEAIDRKMDSLISSKIQ